MTEMMYIFRNVPNEDLFIVPKQSFFCDKGSVEEKELVFLAHFSCGILDAKDRVSVATKVEVFQKDNGVDWKLHATYNAKIQPSVA